MLTSISIYAESKFTFKGEIVDYDTKESLSGAVINLYSGEKTCKSLYSDKIAIFEFTIVKPIDVIEVKFIGKLTLKIIGIDIYKKL